MFRSNLSGITLQGHHNMFFIRRSGFKIRHSSKPTPRGNSEISSWGPWDLFICLSQHHLCLKMWHIHSKGNFNREHDDKPWFLFEGFRLNFQSKPIWIVLWLVWADKVKPGSRPPFLLHRVHPLILWKSQGNNRCRVNWVNWLLLNGSQRASSSFFLLSTSFMKDAILSSWPMLRPIQLEGWFPSKICQHNWLSLWFALNKNTSTRWRCICTVINPIS